MAYAFANADQIQIRASAVEGQRAIDDVSNAPAEDVPRTLERALGLQVRPLRRARDLSIGDLAGVSGLCVGIVSKIEHGPFRPRLRRSSPWRRRSNVPFTSLFNFGALHRPGKLVTRPMIIEMEAARDARGQPHLLVDLDPAAGTHDVDIPHMIRQP